jgi:hypothetical protein
VERRGPQGPVGEAVRVAATRTRTAQRSNRTRQASSTSGRPPPVLGDMGRSRRRPDGVSRRRAGWRLSPQSSAHVRPCALAPEWERFASFVPNELADLSLVDAYARLLFAPDPAVQLEAARNWCSREDTHMGLAPDSTARISLEPELRAGVRSTGHPLLEQRRVSRRDRADGQRRSARRNTWQADRRPLRRQLPDRDSVAAVQGMGDGGVGRCRRRRPWWWLDDPDIEEALLQVTS